MNELDGLIEQLSISRPIFMLSLNEAGTRIEMGESLYKFNPENIETDSVFLEAVVACYSERFDLNDQEFSTNKRDIKKQVIEYIKYRMSDFIEANLQMANPRLSKLYKWFRRDFMRDHYKYDEVSLSVYKYLRQFCDSDMKALDKSSPHVENAFALLTLIMERNGG